MKKIILIISMIVLICFPIVSAFWWTASGVHVDYYYSADEGTGTNLNDDINNKNGTADADSWDADGVFGSEYMPNGTYAVSLGNQDLLGLNGPLLSECAWMKSINGNTPQQRAFTTGIRNVVGPNAWERAGAGCGLGNWTAGFFTGASWTTICSNATVSNNVWTFVCYTHDDVSNEYILYVNGSIVGVSTVESDWVPTVGQTMSWGGNKDEAIEYLNGSMGEVIYSNNTIWTPTEISDMYIASTAPPPASLDVTLNKPDNNSISNLITQTFNFSVVMVTLNLSNCSLFANFSGTYQLNQTNTSFIANNTIYNFDPVDGITDGSYVWNVDCMTPNGSSFFAESNFTLTIDITNPSIIVNPNNFFNTTNKSAINQYGNITVQINVSATDNDNVFAFLMNITKGGVSYYNFSNISVNVKSFNHAAQTDITGWPEGVYDVEIIVADGHHYTGGYQIGDYKVSQVIDKISFDTTEGNRISISGGGAYSTKYAREKNSYSFGYDYFFPSNSRTFIIESDNKIYYIPKSRYKAHFVIWNGEHGNWVDFEGLEGSYEVERISDYKYMVTFSGLYGTEVITRSIGGLNVVTEKYQWYRGTFIDTNPDLFILSTGDFILNLKINTAFITNINATLIYNNTLQEVTRVIGSTYVSFNTTVTTPDITQDANVSFFWNVTVNQTDYGLYDFLIERNNSVENWGLDNCSLYSTHALNFSLQDEMNQSYLMGDISGIFNYTRDNINFRTYTLDMNNVGNISICITPSGETFIVDYDLVYSATGYQQRDFEKDGDVLTNATVKLPLYLLHNDLGLFQRFSVVDTFSNPLSEVRVRMYRTIGSTTRTIEEKLTDASGFVRFWANPDVSYTFTFSKVGFDSESLTLVPDSSEIRTIIMGEEVEEEFISTGTGITYNFLPDAGILNNNTNYTFMFNMTSSYWRITNCTLFLKNSSGGILEQSSSSFNTSHCDIAILRNTGNLTFIKSEAQYTLNETRDETVSVQYTVQYTYKGTFSLMNFFDDLRDFGELGFNDFTRMFIAFIVIFAIVGTAAISLGLREPETLIFLTWSVILFFSYLGWLTLGYADIPDIGKGRAWLQQYIIFIVFSLMAGGYIIKKQSE